MVNTEIKIGGVRFTNPVFAASGTFGYGNEVPNIANADLFGAIVTKSVTLHPREGNPPPRIVETPSGMLNSIGLANIGVDRFIAEMIPFYDALRTQVIMNIAGRTFAEYVAVLEKVEEKDNRICGYEINVSCPNVERGGMEFGVDRELTLALTRELRKRTDKLLIVKLSPNVTDIVSIAKSTEEGGADAVSAINTVVAMSINTATRRSNISTKLGGLSGPAIKPIGIANVYKIAHAIELPVIGVGGIARGNDVVEYLLAGATAAEVGTANFRDPGIVRTILNELEEYCEHRKIAHVSELRGALKDDA